MKENQDQLSPIAQAFSGAIGAVISNGLVYPLDTLKTRIQVKDNNNNNDNDDNELVIKDNENLIKGVIDLFRDEGFQAAYGGFGASMLNTFSQQFAYFYWYGAVRSTWIKKVTKPGQSTNLSTASELLIGAIAGDIAQIFTIPVNVIATRQQIGNKDKNDSENDFITVGKQIIAEDGITGLWRGLKPSLVLSINPAITYGVFERLKTLILNGYIPLLGSFITNEHKNVNPYGNFLLGAFSKTVATIVTYPYIMAKVRVMAGDSIKHDNTNDDNKKLKKKVGALKLLLQLYQNKGIISWYKGMHAQIVKAVLQQALLFMLRDIFEKYTLLGVLLLRKISLKK